MEEKELNEPAPIFFPVDKEILELIFRRRMAEKKEHSSQINPSPTAAFQGLGAKNETSS